MDIKIKIEGSPPAAISPLSSLPPDIAAILHYIDHPAELPRHSHDDLQTPGPSRMMAKRTYEAQMSYDSEDEVDEQLNMIISIDDEGTNVKQEITDDQKDTTELSSDESSASSSDEMDVAHPKKARNITAQSHATMRKRQAYDHEDKDEEESSDEEDALRGLITSKHEVVAPEVAIPTITSVPDHEVIEEIGEIMSIIDSVVVVKGRAAGLREKVLDTGSLLVFDDRKVLGEVFETFGPTSQPLYSILFPSSSSIDNTAVTILRKVFHIPTRSFFVFTRALQAQKGSDASNVYDEETAEWEIEFSDDEKEVEHKRSLKRRHPEQVGGGDNIAPVPIPFSSVPSLPVYVDDGDIPYESSPYDHEYSQSTNSTSVPEMSELQGLDPRAAGRNRPAPYEDFNPLENHVVDEVVDSHRGFNSNNPRGRGRGNRARTRGRARGGGRGGNRQGRIANSFSQRGHQNLNQQQHGQQMHPSVHWQSPGEYNCLPPQFGFAPSSSFAQPTDYWSNNLPWVPQNTDNQDNSYDASWDMANFNGSLANNGVTPHINPRFFGHYGMGNVYAQPHWDMGSGSGGFSQNQLNLSTSTSQPSFDFTNSAGETDIHPSAAKRDETLGR